MRDSSRFIIWILLSFLVACESSAKLPTAASEPIGADETPWASTASAGVGHEPFACELVDSFRAQPTVTGRLVEIATRIEAFAIDGTWGRVAFWPNGRHNDPKIVSDLFESGSDDDFPVSVDFSYRYPSGTASGEKLAHVDYEMLLKCFDEATERFILGGFDEFGFCRAGTFIVLQCDRGVSYTIP